MCFHIRLESQTGLVSGLHILFDNTRFEPLRLEQFAERRLFCHEDHPDIQFIHLDAEIARPAVALVERMRRCDIALAVLSAELFRDKADLINI